MRIFDIKKFGDWKIMIIFAQNIFTPKNMLTYIMLFLIDSIVSCFVTIDLPRTDGTKQVPSVSCVATRELLSIDFHQFIHCEYLPRFGIVARSA